MNITGFRAQFPEFANASNALVQAQLDAAAEMLSEEIFGNQYDQAHAYYTAHLMALSPFGRNAKLTSKDGRSVYQDIWEKIRDSRTIGFRVA